MLELPFSLVKVLPKIPLGLSATSLSTPLCMRYTVQKLMKVGGLELRLLDPPVLRVNRVK